MTAFAAVLNTREGPPAVAGIAEALGALTGAAPSVVTRGRCAIAAASRQGGSPSPVADLHDRSSWAGLTLRASGVITAGQVLLEGHRHLAAVLGEPTHDGAPALVAASYEQWGERCAERLSGEYAFALWDPREQTLVCARDGLGIRLLYVAESHEALVITNVLAAALRHPSIAGDLDEANLVAFLANGGAGDDIRTCYREVKVLPPGHTLVLRADALSRPALRRHWRFPSPDGVRRTGGEIEEEYRSLLASAVSDRLDPAGTTIFLSGGIDSTTMAAAAREVLPAGRLQAITTRYPRYVEDVELPYTRLAAGHLGLPLAVVDADKYEPWYVDPADGTLPEPMDEPALADWRDAVAAAGRHGPVALYGEDGDALLRPPGWRALRQSASVATIGLAAARYALSERRRPYVGLRWRERVGLVPARGRREAPSWLSARARALLRHSTPARVLGQAAEPLPPHPTRPEAQAALTSTNISRFFAAAIALETIRRPVELRLPILDSRLMRLVVSVPAIPWSQHKCLPRRAYRGRLPGEVLDRPKTPLEGFDEALVASWRSAGGGTVAPPEGPIDEWIDLGRWRATIQFGDASAVIAAWRVGALDRWLRSQGSPMARSGECTR